MKSFIRGPGEPEVAVVYCTHGDETAGKKAVERLLSSRPDFQRAVKFVFANEKAYKEEKRFIDSDLNRSFPGDLESEVYEERIAAQMMDELEDLKVLDIHETGSSPTPFSLFTWMDDNTIGTLKDTGMEKAVEVSYTPGCGINCYGGVEAEFSPKGTEEAVEKAFQTLKQFLINNSILEGEKNKSKPKIYGVYSEEPRPDGSWNILCQNFERVATGKTVAKNRNSERIKARESFIPVLFNEDYSDILGFKAVRLEKVEQRIFNRGS